MTLIDKKYKSRMKCQKANAYKLLKKDNIMEWTRKSLNAPEIRFGDFNSPLHIGCTEHQSCPMAHMFGRQCKIINATFG